jgi:hypothetical protein
MPRPGLCRAGSNWLSKPLRLQWLGRVGTRSTRHNLGVGQGLFSRRSTPGLLAVDSPSGQAPRLSSPSRPYRPEKGGDMIDRFFGDPNVLLRLRSGPLGPYVDGVCRLLVEQDYAEYSVRLRLRLLGVLSQWLGRHGLVVEDLDEQTIAKFLAEPAQARTWVRRSRAVLRSLLDHLRGSGILSAPKVEQQDTPWTGVERAFSRYLIEQRGVLQTTVGRYLYPVRHFLGELFGTGPLLRVEHSRCDPLHSSFVSLERCPERPRRAALLFSFSSSEWGDRDRFGWSRSPLRPLAAVGTAQVATR